MEFICVEVIFLLFLLLYLEINFAPNIVAQCLQHLLWLAVEEQEITAFVDNVILKQEAMFWFVLVWCFKRKENHPLAKELSGPRKRIPPRR